MLILSHAVRQLQACGRGRVDSGCLKSCSEVAICDEEEGHAPEACCSLKASSVQRHRPFITTSLRWVWSCLGSAPSIQQLFSSGCECGHTKNNHRVYGSRCILQVAAAGVVRIHVASKIPSSGVVLDCGPASLIGSGTSLTNIIPRNETHFCHVYARFLTAVSALVIVHGPRILSRVTCSIFESHSCWGRPCGCRWQTEQTHSKTSPPPLATLSVAQGSRNRPQCTS